MLKLRTTKAPTVFAEHPPCLLRGCVETAERNDSDASREHCFGKGEACQGASFAKWGYQRRYESSPNVSKTRAIRPSVFA